MARYRCGIVLAAALLLTGPRVAYSQSSTQPLSYDQLQAAQQQEKSAQDQATAKTSKKKHPKADASATPAASTPVTGEAAPAQAVAPGAAADASTPVPVAAEASAPAAVPAVAEGTVPAVGVKGPDVPKDSNVPAKPIYDKHGKLVKAKEKKEKPPKLVPVDIVHGELTVDGLIAKAGLNFQILDLKYLYIWVPGLGTAVISNQPFAGATVQPDAIDGNTMTVKVDGHQLQLACDGDMLNREAGKKIFQGKKKEKPTSLYVALDTNYQLGSNYPQFGYGDQNKAPYNWPGTLTDLRSNTKTPTLPENLRQKEQVVKLCAKNADGSQGKCRDVDVPLVLGKKS